MLRKHRTVQYKKDISLLPEGELSQSNTMKLDLRYASVIVENFQLACPDAKIIVLRDDIELSYEEISKAE